MKKGSEMEEERRWRPSRLSATLMNNRWRVDASIYMARRCAGGSGERGATTPGAD